MQCKMVFQSRPFEQQVEKAILSEGQASEALAQLAEIMVAPDGVDWHLHGVGIESGETPGETVLRTGTVPCL